MDIITEIITCLLCPELNVIKTFCFQLHNEGQFGIGVQSISKIEGIWSYLKEKIKWIYYIIPIRI